MRRRLSAGIAAGMTRFIALAAAVVAVAFPGCEAETDGDDVLNALVAFARQPSDETWASVPFADRVKLGLADRLLKTRSAQELRDPAAWKLDVDDPPMTSAASLWEGGTLELAIAGTVAVAEAAV